MALKAFNPRFSAKQEALSVSQQGPGHVPEESSTHQQKAAVFSEGWSRFIARDDKRRATDPSFNPESSDLNSERTFDDNEININYYKILGIDEFATQAEVSAAFRKLSLACHPDKVADLDGKEKEAYIAAFEHIRKAHDVLKDNAKRRLYDFKREMAQATSSMQGWNVDWSTSFDVHNVFERLLKRLKPKGSTIEVAVQCKLEKFVHGGAKMVQQDHARFHSSVRQTYYIEVGRGAPEGFSCKFRETGDWHAEVRPDSINFTVTSKRHKRVLRHKDDLVLKEAFCLDSFQTSSGSFSVQTDGVHGQHILVWGGHPFAQADEGPARTFLVCLRGAGVTPQGCLLLSLLSKPAGASVPPGFEQVWRPDLQAFCYYSEDSGQMSWLSSGSSSSNSRAHERDNRVMEPYSDLLRSDTGAALAQIHGPITLQTRPPCTLTFYALRTEDCTNPRLMPLLSVVISSPTCFSGRRGAAWRALKAELVPLLPFWAGLLAAARGLAPRAIALEPHAEAGPPSTRRNRWNRHKVKLLPDSARPVPWARLGDEALRRGDHFQAAGYYASHLREHADTGHDDARISVLCGIAKCFCAMKPVIGSDVLLDAHDHAQWAVKLQPLSGQAWSCLGDVMTERGADFFEEALTAYRRAVEVDAACGRSGCPSRAQSEAAASHADMLAAFVRRVQPVSVSRAQELHAAGNAEMKGDRPQAAVASYTHALALLPLQPENLKESDLHAHWRAVLFANRSACFCQLRNWVAAVADAREAVKLERDSVKAHLRLGTALLGSTMYEEAYVEFIRSEQLLQHVKTGEQPSIARKGTDACLSMFPLWKSLKALQRLQARFDMDACRPRGSCKVYALSNLLFDNKEIEKWTRRLDGAKFKQDVLIVTGNASATQVGLRRTFTVLLRKFWRVFWVPGSREMRIYPSEAKRYPDSFSKFLAILDLCDELGVDILPAAICTGVYVVPLLSWKAGSEDLDTHCKWPMDPRSELWTYMLRLNEKLLERKYDGLVVTASHFAPRRDLAQQPQAPRLGKVPTCEGLDAQVRSLGSKVHLFGSSSQSVCSTIDGVTYLSCCFGQASRSLVIRANGVAEAAKGTMPRAGATSSPSPPPGSRLGRTSEDRWAAAGCPQEAGQWTAKTEEGTAVRWELKKPLQADADAIVSLASLAELDFEGPFFLVGSWDNYEGFIPFSLVAQESCSRVYTARLSARLRPEGRYEFVVSASEDKDKFFFPGTGDIYGPGQMPEQRWAVLLKPYQWLEVRWEVIQVGHLFERNISWRVGRSVALGRRSSKDSLLRLWEDAPLGSRWLGWDAALSTLCVEQQNGLLSQEAWEAAGEVATAALRALQQSCLEDDHFVAYLPSSQPARRVTMRTRGPVATRLANQRGIRAPLGEFLHELSTPADAVMPQWASRKWIVSSIFEVFQVARHTTWQSVWQLLRLLSPDASEDSTWQELLSFLSAMRSTVGSQFTEDQWLARFVYSGATWLRYSDADLWAVLRQLHNVEVLKVLPCRGKEVSLDSVPWTRNYFLQQAMVWLSEDSFEEYLEKAQRAFEEPHIISCLQGSVRQQLAGCFIEAAVISFLDGDKREDLSYMFALCKHMDHFGESSNFIFAEGGLLVLAQSFSKYVAEVGLKLIQESDDHALIHALMGMHGRFKGIVKECFFEDALLQGSLRNSFEVLQVDCISLTAQQSSTYHRIITDAVTLSEAQNEGLPTKAVELLRCMHDKDVFEDMYKSRLSRRLLNDSAVSEVTGKGVIAKLRMAWDAPFSSKVEGMIADLSLNDQLREETGTAVEHLFVHVLRNDRWEDLARLHSMFSLVDNGLNRIAHCGCAQTFKSYVMDRGNEIVDERVEQAKHMSSETEDVSFIQKLLDFHDTCKGIVQECFSEDPVFQNSLKEAFEVFINRDVGKVSQYTPDMPSYAQNSIAMLMSAFCDRILKKSGDRRSDDEVELLLTKMVELFSFLCDWALFAEIYRNQLSKRLLDETSASDDAEKSMIAKLKMQRGAQFTSKLEGMITDSYLASELQKDFREHCEQLPEGKSALGGIDFKVTVLTTGFWPSYEVHDANLCPEMRKAIQVFHNFYNGRTMYRRLQWIHSLGQATIAAKLSGRRYDLIVNSYQALILLLFVKDETHDLRFIQTAIGLDAALTKKLVATLSISTYKILNKSGDDKAIEDDATFNPNDGFSCPHRKVEIDPPVAEPYREPVDWDGSIAIQNAIVRIMKMRMQLSHQELVAEVLMYFSKSDQQLIEQRIEHLIELEYLERDPNEASTYRYCA